ncbi:hemoglobin/transferrin/lactoferrin receptor protein [Rhodoblastus acidophilus]|uniref:Hemoglobin/transferrin/lactoferrin receptor protein n=1 Tax=Rhodoblastus acidophilus TaxID=1074 RepID=A0A212S790_RHOAC|nr:TonB-dependent hemoglobin/transferrin/lactoferrin family receptor [Rhodoblastus acidophilus]PPQ37244.1 TonB-dependent receptor [Rhodoblastus acidophilus]RAI16447.1 TonB-dependent receptor [Rhodoblastus acidophilus]SNB80974.1 hemoglobin/transferrin/lactoferrin receptor protein [Rhodoblastus acidophilus]
MSGIPSAKRRGGAGRACLAVALAAVSTLGEALAEPAADPSGFDTINVTATKTDEKTVDTLAGASTVTAAEAGRFQPSTVSDLLRDVPGVAAQQTANDPGQSINIRGLQDFGRVNVLVDGARQDYQISDHGPSGTFYLEPEFLGRAEVTRGPVANVYGSGAIGGVVSLSTKSVDDILKSDERYGVVQKFGAGTNGQNFLNSTAAGARIDDYADLYAQFLYRNREPYRDGDGVRVSDSGNDAVGGLFKGRLRPAEGQEISLSALTQNFQYANNGTSAAGSRFNNDVNAGTYSLGYRFNRPDIPLLDLSAKVYLTQTHNEQTLASANATYAALGAQVGGKRSDKIDTEGFDLHNTARFATLGADHALTFGGDASWDHVKTYDDAGGFIAALTPSGRRTLSGAFVEDEFRYGGWLRVIGAARYDRYQLNGGVYESSGDRVSPKVTVGVSPVEGAEVFATYAEGYRAPSITETLIAGAHPFPAFTILPNPSLRPEVAHDVEGGVNLKYDDVLREGDKMRAKITAFDNRVTDFIDMETVGASYLVPYIPGMPATVCARAPRYCMAMQSYQYLNVARAEIYGVELEAAYDWRDGFASVNATLNQGRNLETRAPLNSVRPHRLGLTGGLRFLNEALTIGGRATFVGDSPRDVTTPSGGYALFDLFADYKHNDWLNAGLSVTNLFDRRYVQYLDTLASPGLTAKLTLTVKYAAK